jgi:hypothetical protein
MPTAPRWVERAPNAYQRWDVDEGRRLLERALETRNPHDVAPEQAPYSATAPKRLPDCATSSVDKLAGTIYY